MERRRTLKTFHIRHERGRWIQHRSEICSLISQLGRQCFSCKQMRPRHKPFSYEWGQENHCVSRGKGPEKQNDGSSSAANMQDNSFEASPILYSENTFHVSDPNAMLTFMRQIGLVNTSYLKTLRIWVAWRISSPWLRLLCMLAQRAKGLRKIMIT
jgi:hypothetical protein